MDPHESNLWKFMQDNGISGEVLHFEESCHSVAEAAAAAKVDPDLFVKNICMIGSVGLIVTIVKGEDRVSTTNVGEVLGIERPRTATPDEILFLTGYPCGGTRSFGYKAVFLIDERVMEREIVYSGGGSTQGLVRIASAELVRANGGKVCRVRK